MTIIRNVVAVVGTIACVLGFFLLAATGDPLYLILMIAAAVLVQWIAPVRSWKDGRGK